MYRLMQATSHRHTYNILMCVWFGSCPTQIIILHLSISNIHFAISKYATVMVMGKLHMVQIKPQILPTWIKTSAIQIAQLLKTSLSVL